MKEPRKPAAFRMEPEEKRTTVPEAEISPRRPRALDSPSAIVTPAEIDVFDEGDPIDEVPPPPTAPKRRSWLATIFVTAFGALVSLAIGLWTDQLIRELFSRAEWLGWLAAGLAALAALALLFILIREMMAIARLASVEKLRARALDAITRDDPKAARTVVAELSHFVSHKPETAGRPARAYRAWRTTSSTAPIWSASPKPKSSPRSTRERSS